MVRYIELKTAGRLYRVGDYIHGEEKCSLYNNSFLTWAWKHLLIYTLK